MSERTETATGWVKHPTWKPGDPQPRLSNGWYGVRVAPDGGFEVLPPSAPDRFLERIAQAHGHSMTKALRDMLWAAYRAGANSQKLYTNR